MIIKPDYIGYWITDKGKKDFFIITFKEAKEEEEEENSTVFTGTGKDHLGKSDVRGNMNNKEIYFEKIYITALSSKEAIDQIVIYHGEREKSSYEGQYHSLDWKHKGIFVIDSYPINLTKTIEAIIDKEFEK